MKLNSPIILGASCGLIGLTIALSGYGYVVVYIWRVILIMFLVLASPALFRRKLIQYFLHLALIAGIATGLWYGGMVVRKFQKSRSCRELNALISKVNEFHEKTGHYPEHLDDLSFSTRLSLKSDVFKDAGVNLNGVNNHDAVVYLGTDGFICIVPVTKMLPISITRFYAYIWTSLDSEWRYAYMIWTLGKI